MRDLAQVTGGRNYRIEDIADLEKTFGEIAAELGRQYTLSYYPSGQSAVGQKRQSKVKILQPNLAVRARDEYIVQSPEK